PEPADELRAPPDDGRRTIDDEAPASPKSRTSSLIPHPSYLVRAGQVLAGLLILGLIAQEGRTAYARYFVDQANLLATWREMYVPEMRVAQLLKQYEGQYTFYISPIYKGLPPQAYLAPNVTEPQDYPGEWAIP